MKTKQDIQKDIKKTAQLIAKTQDPSVITALVNYLSRLSWLLNLHENITERTQGCLIATGTKDNDAVKVAEHYRTQTHIKAWPGVEPYEAVFFPYDNGDLLMLLDEFEGKGFKIRIAPKE